MRWRIATVYRFGHLLRLNPRYLYETKLISKASAYSWKPLPAPRTHAGVEEHGAPHLVDQMTQNLR